MVENNKRQPKILIFTIASWNSKVGDNTWETLVSQYDSANLANIFLREEIPDSTVCSKYFCISENRVLKSIFKRNIKTGKEIKAIPILQAQESEDLKVHRQRYLNMKKKRRYSMLLARELCWKLGKWKTKELDDFLDEFKPDIILHGMDGYIHINRIVRYAIKRTGAKAIGCIWDDTFTYKQSKKFGHNLYRFFQRKSLKKLAKKTSEFFAITPKTKQEADKFFGINCTILTKPLNTIPIAQSYEKITFPIKMLYTGNLSIGRDVSLKDVSLALKKVNANEKKIVLDVYTQTVLSEQMLNEIENEFCHIYPPISQQDVLRKQKEADVLLFLEDLSDKELIARLSFSTKITDYFSAGKCILAIGNYDLAPIQYFKETKSAIVVDKLSDIESGLQKLLDINMLEEIAINAVNCGQENHNATLINNTFKGVIDKIYIKGQNEGFTN